METETPPAASKVLKIQAPGQKVGGWVFARGTLRPVPTIGLLRSPVEKTLFAAMQLTLKLVMNSDPRLLSVVRSAVEQLASVCGFPEEECRAITLAVDEAVCNVIRHAYHDRHDQVVELTCQRDDKVLEFVLVDHGQTVDRSKVCSRSLDEIKPGGLGTHIIRQAMDHVSYEPLPGGNQLRLVKYFPKTEQSVP